MAAPVPKLQLRLPRQPAEITAEQKFWKTFRSPVIIKEYAPVTHLHFSPLAPFHDLAVSASARVILYDTSQPSTPKKTISRFSDVAYSANIRADGKLLIAGDKSGCIQLFDASSRSILRKIDPGQAHSSLPVWVTKFDPNSMTQFLSAGDDNVIKMWDVTSDKATAQFSGHVDYIRTVEYIRESGLIVSGSLDGTVRIWDPRGAQQCVQRFEQGMTAESMSVVMAVAPLRGGTMIASAGGEGIAKIWDMIAGKPLTAVRNHQRDVTCLALNADGSRLLSGGLDNLVKIYDTTSWKVVHGAKYPAPILSLALSHDNMHLVAGMSNNLLSIRSRRRKKRPLEFDMDATVYGKQLTTLTKAAPPRQPLENAIVVEDIRIRKLEPYERAFRSYRYGDALDAALAVQPADALAVLAVLRELRHRSGLKRALQNREDTELEPILTWMAKHISNPIFADAITDVFGLVVDLYGLTLADSVSLHPAMVEIAARIDRQIEKGKEARLLMGQIDMLVA